MESKFTPASDTHVHCIKDTNAVQNGESSCHCNLKYVVWALTLFVVLLTASSIYLHFELNNMKIARTANPGYTKTLSKSSHSGKVRIDKIKQPSIIDIRRRHIVQMDKSRRKRHRRGQRSLRTRVSNLETQIENLKGAILKQVVHLRGSREVNSQATRNPVHGVAGCGGSGCFRWSRPDSMYSTNFDYIVDYALNKVVGIKILSPGVYLIYSQVGVNGPQQSTNPSVGYETVKTDSSGITIVLMRTFITQDERGRRDGMYRPHDSINQLGVFKLHCGDTIVVRQDTPVENNPPDIVFDKEQSFFGIVQINPTNGALDGNYDCNAP